MNKYQVAKIALSRILASVDLKTFGQQVIRETTDFDVENFADRDLINIAVQEACTYLHKAIYRIGEKHIFGHPKIFSLSVAFKNGEITTVYFIFELPNGVTCMLSADTDDSEEYEKAVEDILKRM